MHSIVLQLLLFVTKRQMGKKHDATNGNPTNRLFSPHFLVYITLRMSKQAEGFYWMRHTQDIRFKLSVGIPSAHPWSLQYQYAQTQLSGLFMRSQSFGIPSQTLQSPLETFRSRSIWRLLANFWLAMAVEINGRDVTVTCHGPNCKSPSPALLDGCPFRPHAA